MKTFILALLVCVLFIAPAAMSGNLVPPEKVEVIDNDGVIWGSIPPIENMETLMSHVKWNPILSKDGEWLVFVGKNSRKLWLVPSEGGTPVEIFNLWNEPLPEGSRAQLIANSSLAFTSDGNEIAFTLEYDNAEKGSYDANPDPDFSTPKNQLYSVMAFNPSTQEYRKVVENARYYDWSADGRYVSFIRIDPRAYYDPDNAEHHCAPAIYDTQTGETRYLTDENWNQNMINQTLNGQYPNMGTTFSPDGSHIVASKFINGSRQLVKIPFEGGESEQITFVDVHKITPFPYCIYPKYSPNGDWIIFRIEYTLVIMSTQTGEIYDFPSRKPFELLDYPVETSVFQIKGTYNVNWSFDGKKILYNIWSRWDTLQTNVPSTSEYGVSNTYILIYDFEPLTYEMITSVEEIQPEEFSITGNYPNPFNPTTSIDFSLPEAGHASLAVFNVNGQKMRELVSGNLTAGRHSVVWDGRDQNGNTVSSGVYITRLMMRDKVTTGQMMLLK